MTTNIELKASEFDEEVFLRIKSFLTNKTNAKVFISIDDNPENFPFMETREEYFTRLDTAIKNVKEGNGISFTWDEFEDFTKQLLNEP
jgi:hypothetical protein